MSKKLLTLLSVLAVMFAAPLSAQTSPTPEGTVISNQATVTFTDVNGNSYTPVVSTAVTVTVGFVGSIDVTGQASYTPGSASTGNFAVYTIANLGNGHDSVTVSTSAAAGLTITGYKIGVAATVYNDLTTLNAALAAMQITRITGTVDITVIYDVAANKGGSTMVLALTGTSRRDNTKTDTHNTNIMPPVANNTVNVTADVPTVNRLRTGTGADYTTSFTIANGANATRTYSLGAVAGGTGITITSVNGGTATVTVAASSSSQVNVTYTVGNVANASTGTVTLTATDTTDALVTDNDVHTVTVIYASMTISKLAYRADATTLVGAGLVVPGETIVYKLTVTNNGTVPVNFGTSITDPLPAQVTYVSATGPAGWTVGESGGTVTATLDSPNTLAPAATAVIVITVTIK